jgi:hypothetical protein
MSGRISGEPDQNHKPSTIIWDSVRSTTFAQQGDSTLGVAYIQVVDNSGTPIVSFGGGTQYTDGGTPPAHPIGPTLLWNNAGTWEAVSNSNPLPVTGGGGGTQYTDAGTPPAHPVGGALVFDNGSSAWQAVNSTHGLPVSIVNPSVAVTGTFWQATQPVSGTFWQATQPVSLASVPSHAVTNAGTFAVQATEADGANTTLGAKADAKNAATDATAVSIMSVLKQISASVQAPPSQAVTNAGTFAVQSTPVTQADTFMLGGVNVKEINGITPLMGAGNGGTGSLRVNIASDQVSIPVAATLNAETTKAIGVVRNSDGAGNLLTSNSTTTTAKFGLDTNILSILGTAPTTAGKLDVKAADGDIFVRSNAASTFPTQATLQTQTDTVMVGGVNIKEINAVTPLMGNGATGTGSQRVTVASDNTAVANWGQGATGSAVPSGAQYDGGVAKTALPSAASDGNLTGKMVDKFGRQVVLPVTIRDLTGTQTTTISSSTSETTIVTAAASVFNDLLMLVVSNTSATATRVDFRDTTGGSVLFSLYVPAADVRGFSLGGVAVPQTSVNTNWTAQCGTSVADIRVYAVFAKNK